MSRWSRAIVLGACLSALAGAGVPVTLASASIPRQVRVGRAPLLPPGAKTVGALAAPSPLSVAVTLQPRDPAALAAYATAVATPGSAVYHDYVTVAQFAQRFGPTTAQISAVESALRAQGLDPGAVSANGLSIPVSATAGQFAHAFSIGFNRVSLSNGRSAYANTEAPSLVATAAGYVQSVVGLNTLSVPQPVSLARAEPHAAARVSTPDVATGGPQPCSEASGVKGAYTADQIASAYGFSHLYGAGDEGAGETVALYELEPDPTLSSDIAAYQACYHTDATVTTNEVDGGGGTNVAGDGVETDLDVEDVIGLAPEANIIVYQGPNANSGPYDTYQTIITHDQAKVISTSWVACESEGESTEAQAENTLFQEAATQGQTIVAAAGDDGSDCGLGTDRLAVDDPASQPYVTGVGGTTLSALGPPPTETVWADDTSSHECISGTTKIPCGGGGGISTLWPMPSYQSEAPSALNVMNPNSSGSDCGATTGTDCREVPDVSASADPYEGYAIYYDGNGLDTDTSAWESIGGTSGAAPTWAAFTALVNASSACIAKAAVVGFLNPSLYTIAGTEYSADFNDVTSGNNDITGNADDLFPAGTGYDMASGLGTPNGATLPAALCAEAPSGGSTTTTTTTTTATTPPSTTTTPPPTTTTTTTHAPAVTITGPGNQSGTVRKPAYLQIEANDGGGTLTYSATGLPSGLSIKAATGLISGTPTAPGYSTVAVSVKDSAGGSGETTFRWTIGGLPTASGASLTGISDRDPKLTFTVTAGVDAPALKTIVVTLPNGLRFARSGRRLLAKLTVEGVGGRHLKFTAKLTHGVLTIALRAAGAHAKVIIAAPALGESAAVVAKFKRRHVSRLDVTVKAIDSANFTTMLGLDFRIRTL